MKFGALTPALLILSVIAVLAPAGSARAQVPPFGELVPPMRWLLGTLDGPRRELFVDVNADGVADVVYPHYGPGQAMWVALSDGMGGFHPAPPIQFPTFPNALAVAGFDALDLDGDGDLDFVACISGWNGGPVPGPIVTFTNDGAGTFVLDTGWRFPVTYRAYGRDLLAFDVDRDGDEDVLVLPYWSHGFPALFLNDGNGFFAEAQGAVPAVSPVWGKCVAVDLDKDGALDFVGPTTGLTDQPEVWINDGRGSFQQTSHGIPAMSATMVDVGDVDRDGDVDLLFGSHGYRPQLWLGDGRGTFREASPAVHSGTPINRYVVQLVDFDRDGWLDLFSLEQYRPLLLRNTGTGSFADVTAQVFPPGAYGNVRFQDLDRDGDVDIIARENFGSRFFTNLTRQIHANDPPLGGRLDIDLYGPSNDLATYSLGFARRDVQVPGFGWWALDPSASVAWPQSIALPASRTHRSSWSIPQDPQLLGLEIFVQSIQVDPTSSQAHLTGFWKSTVVR